MSEIVVAFIVFFGGMVTMLLGFWGSKKFHIGPHQEILVKTLQDVIAAQSERIVILEKQLEEQRKRISDLTDRICTLQTKVQEMEEVIVGQAKELYELEHITK